MLYLNCYFVVGLACLPCHYTNMPCQCGYPDGMSPWGGKPSSRVEGRHSIRIPTLAWRICFIIPNKPQFRKISIKTTMTAGRSAGAVEKSVCCSVYNVKVTDDGWLTHSPLGVTTENGEHFGRGHFAGGHDVQPLKANHGLGSSREVL